MKYLKILLFALFFLYVSPLFAQKQSIEFIESNFAKKKKSLQVALRNLKIAQGILEIDQDYASALKYYLRANKFNPKNAQLNYIIGKCYLYQKNPDLKSAIKHLEEASSFTACDPEIVYLLACTYQQASEWQKAINEFKRYIKMVEDQNEKVAKAQKRLQECESGKTLSQNPRHITIEHLGKQFNTRFDEMGPVISADEKMMLFTAKRNTTTGYEMSEDGLFYEDIYVAHKNKGGNWTKFTKLQGVNSNGSDAIVSITSNGKRIILYKGVQNGDLYAGTIEKDKVYDIKPLPNVFNTPFRETSATMNSENNLIFFTSNRPGGKGGLDIWFSRKNENNTWEEAQNMGELINTPYDEEGVCLSADGKTLYFSSKGHNSIGGYDIFKTVFREGTWSKPENIGIPLNTPNDEVFVSLSQDGKRLYFSSFRNDSYGASDIYIATLLGEPKEPDLTPITALNTQQAVEVGLYTPSSTIERILLTDDYTVVKGKVLDPDTGKPLSAQIIVSDNEKEKVVSRLQSNPTTGEFEVALPEGGNYGIAVKTEGRLIHSTNVDTRKKSSSSEKTKPTATTSLSTQKEEIFLNVQPQKVVEGSIAQLNNIFFDVDKADLRKESTIELDYIVELMNQYPNMVIEVAGHTDNTGTAEHNMALSSERARAVSRYLVSKGIPKKRIISVGYGMSQPIASNDTEEGRQANRRTEFKIIKIR